MQRNPPDFLAPSDEYAEDVHGALLLRAERGLTAAIADAAALSHDLDAQALVAVLVRGGGARDREMALKAAVAKAQASLHAAEIASREALDRDVSLLCADLEAEIGDIEAKDPRYGGNPMCVVPTPDIKCFRIKSNYDYIMLGCDGVFEKLENKHVINAAWDANRCDFDQDAVLRKNVD